MKKPRTNAQLVKEGNELARQFYESMGYVVPVGYRFDKATHPQEIGCWYKACLAYEHIDGTDLQEAAEDEET